VSEFERANARLLDEVAGRLRPARSPGAVVRQYWRAFTAPEVLPQLRLRWEARLRWESQRLDGQDPQLVARRVLQPWLSLVREQLVQAGVPPARAGRAATLVLGALDGMVLDLLATGQRSRVEGGVRELASLADSAQRGPENR
jgi:hypothetical protein